MDIEQRRQKLEGWTWNQNKEGIAGTGVCPLSSNGTTHRVALSTSGTSCLGNPRCDPKLLAAYFAGAATEVVAKAEPDSAAPPIHTNGHVVPDLTSWRLKLYEYGHQAFGKVGGKSMLAGTDRTTLVDTLVADYRSAIDARYGLLLPIPPLTATDLEEELYEVAGKAVDAFLRVQLPARTDQQLPDLPAIPWEGFDQAVLANEEYLKRTPVIEKLCYSSAVSMITGGKHAGKSTLARWMAICVVKGWEFLRRPVVQGPVLYIASEDETMAARQELIRLGWNQDDALRFLSASQIQLEQREFLQRLTVEIVEMKVSLVIIDMLFDFVPISDEMSYAGTREAVGLIQEVASESKAHIVAIHHAPKNANIGDAAVAALGSQGLAARVSPILLVRRFGPGVHSISSTGVRDPRGESITESKLVKNEDGSVELGGGWKNYMLAEVYVGRVKEMLEEDPGVEMTAPEVAEALTITYEVARSCLSTMYKNGLCQRDGQGKKGKPFRYSIPNAQPAIPQNPTSIGTVGFSVEPDSNPDWESRGRFGYKEN